MPFVQRVVEPKYLSRTSLFNENGEPLVADCELEAVTNNTLSNALRQLASLVLVANDIFTELTKELQNVTDRSASLKLKIGLVEDKLNGYDPKKVPVPEGDISTFALLRNHFERKQHVDTALFTSDSRPSALRALYEAAAKTPVHAMRQMDRWRRDGHRSSRFFLCTPVLGEKRRRIRNKIDIDIETRMPASVGELRRWTSAEAIGDITVTPDGVNRINSNTTTTTTTAIEDTDITDTGATSDTEGIDHKLPSPEEQLKVLALKFPAEIIPVDVSGRRFDRMSVQRRSLLHASEATCEDESGTVRRRTRTRKPRGKRRNTLAGTDQKEIVDALTAGDESTSVNLDEPQIPEIGRSRSTDILRSKKSSPPDGKKSSHFNTLKQWGKNRLKSLNKSSESKSQSNDSKIDIDDINIYETVTMRRRKNIDKETTKSSHERKTSYSSSEKSSNISLPISTPLSAAMSIAVKLRESSAQRRRKNKDEQHSSSGNWSASSESGRASIGSEITSTTHPKSTTSTATSSISLNHHGPPSSINSRRRFINTSTSSSVTSEGTLTPDIIHDIHDDGETSSVYSCDTEGYYTSFHMDSGLKTLREEELGLPITPLHTTSAFSNSSGNCTVLTAENEYELFGKGSTSTTTSSAGTVCTTLRASESNKSLIVGPMVPERKSSLNHSNSSTSNSLEREFGSDKTGTVKRSPATSNKATVVAVVHKQQSGGDISPDSGHNTSSSPIESVSSPNGAPSSSEFEFSESSDLEGVDRIERIRIKTTINSSRIPSMCVITPPHSDDESVKSVQNYKSKLTKETVKNNLNIPHLGSKNANRPKLNLNLQPTETDLDSLTFADSENNNKDELDSSKSQKPQEISINTNAPNKLQLINVDPTSGYATINTIETKQEVIKNEGKIEINSQKSVRAPSPSGGSLTVNENNGTQNTKSSPSQPILKATLMPLNNMFGRLKTNLSNLAARKEKSSIKPLSNVENLFDSGDYVTIADVRNNNEKAPITTTTTSEAVYANDVVKKKPVVDTTKSPVHVQKIKETEYISLNELPENQSSNSATNSLERHRRQGARVTLDADGKVVYSSDSLKRRKGAHTTFEPGPFVKDITNTPTASPLPSHRTPKTIRPVVDRNRQNSDQQQQQPPSEDASRPLSPQLNKVVIRANTKTSQQMGPMHPTQDCVRMPPATIVTPTVRPMSPKQHPPTNARGAYVHMQEDRRRDRSQSPAHNEERAHSPSRNLPTFQMHPQTIDRYYHRQSPVEYLPPQNYQKQQDAYMLQRNSPLYRTLPSRMYHNSQQQQQQQLQDERARTPDITRGLNQFNQPNQFNYEYHGGNSYSSLPRRPIPTANRVQQFIPPQQQQYPNKYNNIPNYVQQNQVPFLYETNNVQSYQVSTPPKMENNISNASLSSSPIIAKNKMQQTLHNESLRISPIDPRSQGGFQSSTPSKPKEQSSSIVNLNNKLLSPKKSTMSNDELYAMIHKSKKKLNIKTDDLLDSPASSVSNLSPSLSGRSTPTKQPETGYLGEARTRNSWSPNSDNLLDGGSKQTCSDRLGTKQTSRLDFKKLLLQHGSKTNIINKPVKKLSAVEQLKISKSQGGAQQQQQIATVKQPPAMNILDLSSSPRGLVHRKLTNVAPGSPEKQQRPPSKLLSPRSNWRFANPRSDVLSSTILEDCREDESPNSSTEKNKSPNNQGNVVRKTSSSNVVADKTPRSFFAIGNSSSSFQSVVDKPAMSRAQMLQAQRAEFFKNPSNLNPNTNTNTNTSSFPKNDMTRKTPSPPTLETAL